MAVSTEPESRSAGNPNEACPAVKQADGWAFVDRAYCISLAERPDRRQRAEVEFAKVGLGGKVRYWIVHKHPTDSEQGIYESHIACLKDGLASSAETIAVFEDDVCFERFSLERLNEAARFLRGVTWDVFFLGCFSRWIWRTAKPSVVKVRLQCTAHAYVVTRAFAQRLAAMPWHGKAFDDQIRDTPNVRSYAIRPMCAFQGDASTDNEVMRRLHRIRNLFGGLRRLQKFDEFWHFYFWTILGIHVALAAIVMLAWVAAR